MIQLNLGDVTVHRLLEQEGPSFEPTFFFPDATMEGFGEQMDWLAPHFWDMKANTYIRSIQSYLIRTSHHWILVDACVGNDKERPSTPGWHGLKSSWLEQLAPIGVHPEEIDFVLCTHLHADHVGWNTQLVGNRWVPTFPNAKYIVHKKEYQHWVKHGDGMEGPGSADGCFEDSVLPVMKQD
jgi:glyoxylase-like metal-dependent hydrolase (beta-lactamase superfamily II)